MKYWRGYLIAFIASVLTWALTQFAAAHTELMDMVYPYMTRLLQTNLATWSGGVEFCLWQAAIMLFFVAIAFSIVLMVILRWNPIQVYGWILVPVALVGFLSTAVYGMNEHTGTIADDLRISMVEHSVTSLEEAATYYANQAERISGRVTRRTGVLDFAKLETLAEKAGEGFEVLVYEKQFPIFAGSLLPVKELGWSDMYTEKGVMGMTVALTGESAVNPNVPDLAMPFAICHEMSHRMSIARDDDANMAAILACISNPSLDFQYSGYMMALRYCYDALSNIDRADARAALIRVDKKITARMKTDMAALEDFFPEAQPQEPAEEEAGSQEPQELSLYNDTVSYLVSWHVETVVLPKQEAAKPVVTFDPLDEKDDRFFDVLNPTAPTPPETEPETTEP